MRIIVTTEPPGIRLGEPAEFSSFAVSAPGALRDDLNAHLGSLGEFDGEHVWVDLDGLVSLAGTSGTDPEWRQGLDAMVRYAREHSFLSEDGGSIRAHVDWG